MGTRLARTGSRHSLHGKDRNSSFTLWQGQAVAIYYVARTEIRLLLCGKDRQSPFTTWQGQKFTIYHVARTKISQHFMVRTEFEKLQG